MAGFLETFNNNYKAIVVIAGIFVAGITGWWRIEAKAEDVAEKTVRATVNKEMVDGAKKAAQDAVKEALKDEIRKQLPEISRQVVKDTIQELKDQKVIK
jgi:hypothetical protein